jgi:hypothetical protein
VLLRWHKWKWFLWDKELLFYIFLFPPPFHSFAHFLFHFKTKWRKQNEIFIVEWVRYAVNFYMSSSSSSSYSQSYSWCLPFEL